VLEQGGRGTEDMQRIPEPELMDNPQQVAAFGGCCLDNATWLFVQCLRRFFPGLMPSEAILDLGCGPAAIPLRLARLFPRCEIHGVEGARRMLASGEEAVRREGLEKRVRLFHRILPTTFSLPRERYEMVISNSFLHHLADPMVLWRAIHRYGLPHAAVLVIDLVRPESEKAAELVIDTYLPGAPSLLRQDMLFSLRAAYTLEEVRAQMQKSALSPHLTLTMASPCQFAVYGYLPPTSGTIFSTPLRGRSIFTKPIPENTK
jgi:ubiquinone/menaquinone biosynthesis C-methylase UbiE